MLLRNDVQQKTPCLGGLDLSMAGAMATSSAWHASLRLVAGGTCQVSTSNGSKTRGSVKLEISGDRRLIRESWVSIAFIISYFGCRNGRVDFIS
jgi:hypothetical protein